MGIFKALETIGRTVCGQTDAQKARREASLEASRARWDYQKAHKNDYVCRYCGATSFSIDNLTHRECQKSPNGWHVPY